MIDSQYFIDLLKMNLWITENNLKRENIISILKDNRRPEEYRRYQLIYWSEPMRIEIQDYDPNIEVPGI